MYSKVAHVVVNMDPTHEMPAFILFQMTSEKPEQSLSAQDHLFTIAIKSEDGGHDIVPPDDAEEVVPPPKHVLFYTLDKKKSIVAEAYAVGNSIKSTARK